MIGTFVNGLDELYGRAKFGEDRATRAGCRCENMVFVFCVLLSPSEAGALFVRGVQSSNMYCVTVTRSILILFSPFFRSDCRFAAILPLKINTIFSHLLPARVVFAKIVVPPSDGNNNCLAILKWQ